MSENDNPSTIDSFIDDPENKIRYKKCGKYIVTLLLFKDSKTNEARSTFNPVYAKYRTNKALVLNIEHMTTGDKINEVCNSTYKYGMLNYHVNEIVETSYNDNIDIVCAAGIHYYKTKEQAFCHGITVDMCRVLNLTCNLKRWQDDGSLISERNYISGKLNGICRYVDRHHKLRDESEYFNGKMHGVRKKWRDDGSLSSERNYVSG